MMKPLAKEKTFLRKTTTWFLVADGAKAQVYVCEQGTTRIPLPGNARHHHYEEKVEPKMIPVPQTTWTAESIRDFEAGKRQLGRVFESGNPTRHSVTPRLNLHQEIKSRFMHVIAAHLQAAHLNRAFDQIVLIAPPQLMGELRKHLGSHLLNCVLAELPKELTHCNRRELLRHVKYMKEVIL